MLKQLNYGICTFSPKTKGVGKKNKHKILSASVLQKCFLNARFIFCRFADGFFSEKTVAKSVKIRRLWDKNGNRRRSHIAFVICACFNILNEFLCVGWSIPTYITKSKSGLRSKLLIMIMRITMLYWEGVAVRIWILFAPHVSSLLLPLLLFFIANYNIFDLVFKL